MLNIVFLSDYGTMNGVAQLYGVCKSIDNDLQLYDLSHEISHFDVVEAAESLTEAISYWDDKTVFVSLVDPLTGIKHPISCVKTIYGNYVVSADNETIRILENNNLVVEKKDITEFISAYADTQPTKLLHGRDLAYYAAYLASGKKDF